MARVRCVYCPKDVDAREAKRCNTCKVRMCARHLRWPLFGGPGRCPRGDNHRVT